MSTSIFHKAAEFAKKLDYSNKGISADNADLLELRKFLEQTASLKELKAATEELYELAERRPYGGILTELAKVMHKIHEKRRKQ